MAGTRRSARNAAQERPPPRDRAEEEPEEEEEEAVPSPPSAEEDAAGEEEDMPPANEEDEDEEEDKEEEEGGSRRRSGRLRSRPRVEYNVGKMADAAEEDDEDEDASEHGGDDNDDEDDDDDDDASDATDVEERPARKRRAAAATPASAGRKRARKAASQPRAKRARKRRGAAGAGGDDEEEDEAASFANATELFRALAGGGVSVKMAVSGWARRYAAAADKGAAELVNLVLQAAGSRAALSAGDVAAAATGGGDELAELVRRTTEAAEVPEGAYPAVASRGSLRDFGSQFGEFLQKAVFAVRETALDDGTLLPVLGEWLAAAGTSPLSCFRHTALLAADHLITGLVRVCVANDEQAAVLERHLEAARAPRRGSANPAKVRQLGEDVERLRDQTEQAVRAQAALFKAVWAKRQADTRPATRRRAIEALGRWVAAYPRFWLRDNHLKYLGWLLSDKDAGVRLACLEALAEVQRDPANAQSLELFLERFKPRFLEMVRDPSPPAAAAAVSLLQALLSAGVLADGEGDDVPGRIWDADDGVAAAAAAFAYEDVFAPEDPEAVQGETEQERRERNAEDLGELIKMYHLFAPPTSPDPRAAAGAGAAAPAQLPSEPRELVATLVRFMWPHLPFLCDWSLMRDRLVASQEGAAAATAAAEAAAEGGEAAAAAAEEERRVREAQTLTLTRILVASARRVVEAASREQAPARRAGAHAELQRARRAAAEMRAYFVPVLGPLLQLFHVDAKHLHELAELVRLVGPEAFVRSRDRNGSMAAVLAALRAGYLKHSSPRLLARLSGVLAALAAEASDNPVAADAQAEVRSLADDLSAAFGPLSAAGLDAASLEGGGADERAVVSQLRKMQLLYAENRVAELAYSDELDGLLRTHILDQGSQGLLRVLLRYHLHEVLWHLVPLAGEAAAAAAAGDEPPAVQEDEAASVGARVEGLVKHLEDVLCDDNAPLATAHEAYLLACDLFSVARPALSAHCPALAPLVARPSDAMVSAMCAHLAAVVNPTPEQARRLKRRGRRSLGGQDLAATADTPPFDAASLSTRLETLQAAIRVAAAEPAEYAPLAAEVMLLHGAPRGRRAEVQDALKYFVRRLRDAPGAPLLPVQYAALRCAFERCRSRDGDWQEQVVPVAMHLARVHPPLATARPMWPLFERALRYAFESPPRRFEFLPAALSYFLVRCPLADVRRAKPEFERLAAEATDLAGRAAQAASSAQWSALDTFRAVLDNRLARRPALAGTALGSAGRAAAGRRRRGDENGAAANDDAEEDDDGAGLSARQYKRMARSTGSGRRSTTPSAARKRKSAGGAGSAAKRPRKSKASTGPRRARTHRARRFV